MPVYTSRLLWPGPLAGMDDTRVSLAVRSSGSLSGWLLGKRCLLGKNVHHGAYGNPLFQQVNGTNH